MKFGSVCSGIEAASVAWGPLGWKAAWLSEIEPFPSAVLANHYPDVPNLGDMTLLPERILSGEVEAPDVFCGGTPCQAFSVAGLRNSLDDARGNLSLVFCEIANAIDKVRSVRGLDQSIVFWENVPGVLSTKDNAFGCFLAGLAGEDDPLIAPGGKWTNSGYVLGPKRAVAWRVLDAQYFGVAQRRKRVFVVASARADFDPAAVLFEFDGVRRDTAPSREAGQDPAKCITNGPPFSCTGNERVEADAMVVQPYEVGNCLTARMHKGINSTLDEGQTPVLQLAQPIDFRNLRFHEGDVAGTMQSKSSGGYSLNYETGVMQPIALQDVTPREKAQNGRGWNDDGTAYTVDTHATQGVAQPIPIDMRNAGRDPEKHDEMNRQGVGVGEPGDPAHTVTSAFVHAVAQPIGLDEEQNAMIDAFGTLKARTAGGGFEGSVMQTNMAVRRLTPVECERLQGFPDGYTNIPWRKKDESPDGPRYKALGNSWAVPVVRWIGERIAKAA
jgi:DNA (cytosine-5)-methyltransferase 1